MRRAGQVALAPGVMNGRERRFALGVRGEGIVALTIRTHAQVRRRRNELYDAEQRSAEFYAKAGRILTRAQQRTRGWLWR